MHRRNTLFASIVSIGFLGGCTWSPEANINGGGAGGFGGHNVDHNGVGGSGIQVDANGQPTSDANCGITKIPTLRQPADVVIVFDKSGSMDMDANGGNCNNMPGCSKWDQMTPPIVQAVTATQADVRWGLKFFPDPGATGCQVNNTVLVPVAQNNAMAISTAIGGVNPGGSTPTRTAINNAVTYLNGNGDTNPKYILLATDGLPNCAPNGNAGNSDANGAVTAIANALTAGIPTFVVGIGNTGAASTLTMMAQAGGRPTMAAPFYYQVNSGAELVTALSAISGSVRSCTFSLSSKPPDPANVKVQADGMTVPPSATDGWGYNPGMSAVILTGSYCQNVLNGVTKDVEVLFGCGIAGIP